jgi:ABC-type polysaccharide/polyol phosphate transport system ATPase subunit
MSEGSPTTPAVLVDGVSKRFRIPKEQMHTLKERVLHPLHRTSYHEFRALDDVSFAVSPGEFFGIAGRNGSGKSTLLKCLAGIYRTDAGRIFVDGRVSTFIELGVGFNPDLAAQDNITINAAMLGLSRREARRRFDSIIDFAELRDFTDLKLKNYSSGMLVRLAFSVMIQVDADVLLIDEVLAVGDAAFQQKCFDEFEAIRAAGKTVLLVTHDMGAVRRFCHRAMLLEHGKVVATGDPETVGNRYMDLNFSAQARAEAEAAEGAATAPADASGTYGDGRATIEEAWFEDEHGERATLLHNGRPASFCLRVRFHEPVAEPVFSVTLHNGARVPLFTASSGWQGEPAGTFAAGEEALWRVRFDNRLGPDRYSVTPAVTLAGGASLAVRERLLSVVVTRTAPTGALVDLPFEQEVTVGPVDVTQEVVR